jgi:YhcN/YlaJ family sporulation lipoprotein
MGWNRFVAVAGAFVLVAGLTACNYNSHFEKSSGYDYASRNSSDPRMMQVRSHGTSASNANQHDNRYFEYSPALSRQIAALPGINNAFVFLTDRNAYVGITTDSSATGVRAHGGDAEMEQDNSGTMNGYYSRAKERWDTRNAAPLYNGYFTHKDITDISSKLRQTIGNEIRRAHPRVSEVHISANREYVNQLFEYAKEAWNGKPLAPLLDDFNRLAKYIFAQGTEIPLPLYQRDDGPSVSGAKEKRSDPPGRQ